MSMYFLTKNRKITAGGGGKKRRLRARNFCKFYKSFKSVNHSLMKLKSYKLDDQKKQKIEKVFFFCTLDPTTGTKCSEI